MNKRKLGAAVLLLALGLGPVQTSQNYNFKLNNLAYAEEAASEVGGTEGTQAPDASPKADESEGANKDAEKKKVKLLKMDNHQMIVLKQGILFRMNLLLLMVKELIVTIKMSIKKVRLRLLKKEKIAS